VRLGQSNSAVASGERALSAAQEFGDAALEVMTHVHLCHAYADRGEYRQALDGLRRSVAHLEAGLAPDELHARSNAVSKPEAHACASLSAYLGDVGDFAGGTMYGDRAVMLAEQADHPYTLCLALFRLGHLQLVRGHVPAAIASLERSLTLSEIWDFPPLFPMVAARLGAAYTVAGRTAEGLTMLRRAVDGADAIHLRSEEVLHGVWQAAGYLADGQIDVAGELARHALDLATARGQRSHEARARCLIGQIEACDDPPDVRPSERSFQEALTLAEELGMRPLQAHCHLGLGKLYRRVGRLEEARAELQTSVGMLREMGMAFWLPEAAAELAQVAAAVSPEQGS
jgi:tetratricopeptide (TPR) repeat protein